MSAEDDLEARIAALYELAPEEFVAAREAEAKALRRDKRREDAATVHGLAKPSVPAWAASRTALRHGELLAGLLQAGRALVDAQTAAVRDGDARGLRPAQTERRRVVRQLVDATRVFLTEQSRPGDRYRDELATIFEAASLDPEAAAALATGRLTRTPEVPSGLDLVDAPEGSPPAALDTAPPADAPAPDPAPAPRRRDAERAQRARRQAQAAVETATSEVSDATRDRHAAEEALAAAEAATEAAADEVTELETALAAARQRAEQSAAARLDAERGRDDARRAEEEAATRLADARAALDALDVDDAPDNSG